MAATVEGASKALEAWSVRSRKGEAPGLKDAIVARAGAEGAEVLVIDRAMVFGKDHLRSALYHAVRAMSEGTNSSQSVSMETLLYASGERQLSAAIKKMSVSADTEELVVARLGEGVFEPEPSWTVLPERLKEVDIERLRGFGISPEELKTVHRDKADELVLERVAAVDITKR